MVRPLPIDTDIGFGKSELWNMFMTVSNQTM